MPTELLQRLTAGLSETLVYVIIGLVTLVGFVKCIYPVLRNGSLLNRAVIKLEKSTAQGDRAIWRDARFLGRSLRGDWQRFLLNAGQLDLRGMPCNTDEYINEDTVVYKPGHAQLAELIPSLLTSLGILGTFMGMMEGLSNLDFSNAAGTIESIPSLLNGMRFAFATSVAGITCSLAFNMTNRIMVGRAFKALDIFDEAFYELAMPRPLDPDVQMICQQQDDELQLQRAAENVGSHVAGVMELALSRAMHPLTLSMDNFIKGATQEQVEGIRKIVGQFVQQLNASLEGQMTALADTIRMVNQGQVQTQQNMQRTLDVSQRLAEDAKRIQEASHDIAAKMRDWNTEMDHRESERVHGQLGSLTDSLLRMKVAVDELTQRMEAPAAAGREFQLETAQFLSEEERREEDKKDFWSQDPFLSEPKSRKAKKPVAFSENENATGLEA